MIRGCAHVHITLYLLSGSIIINGLIISCLWRWLLFLNIIIDQFIYLLLLGGGGRGGRGGSKKRGRERGREEGEREGRREGKIIWVLVQCS